MLVFINMSGNRATRGSSIATNSDDCSGAIAGNMVEDQSFPVYDPVLAYISYSMLTSPAEYTKQVVLQFFHPEELVTARQALQNCCDREVLPEIKKRHNIASAKGSSLTVGDLIDGIIALDKANKLPCFAVEFSKLNRIPLAQPCETSNISICERLSKLEARVATNENLITQNTSIISEIKISNKDCNVPRHRPTPVAPPLSQPPPPLQAINQGSSSDAHQSNHECNGSLWAEIVGRNLPGTDGFIHPTKRRSRKRRGVLGKKKDTPITSGPDDVELFVSRVNNCITPETMKTYITDQGVDVHSINVVSHKDSRTKSFKVKIKNAQFKDVMDDSFWPSGVACRKFFYVKTTKDDSGKRNGGTGQEETSVKQL